MKKRKNNSLQKLHHDLEQVTGKTAIAVFSEMQNYRAFSNQANEAEMKFQKDINDNLAAEIMIRELNSLDRKILMKTGEGEKDIRLGHEIHLVEGLFGKGSIYHEGINDPLEGTTLSVKKAEGVCSAIAVSEKGGIRNVPEEIVYMQKLITPKLKGISIDDAADMIVEKVTAELKINLNKLRISVMNRARNDFIIDKLKPLQIKGLELNLIDVGDFLPSITAIDKPDITGKFNIVMGIGGAPEGMIAAAAAKAGGKSFFQARWWSKDEKEKRKFAKRLNLDDLIPASPTKTVVKVAHITSDSLYTGRRGVRLNRSDNKFLVDFTSIDNTGINFITRKFKSL